MNPGTVLFIVLGLIGLLIYISKALKPSSLENFTVIEESAISNKGKEGLEKLKDSGLNFESLLGAFTTPEVKINSQTSFGSGPLPSVSDFANIKRAQEMPVPMPNPIAPVNMAGDIQPQNLSPVAPTVSPTVTPIVINKAPALPPLTPASLITMPNTPLPVQGSPQIQVEPVVQPKPITISDAQGASFKKSAEPFEEQRDEQRERRNKRYRRHKSKIVYVEKDCPKLPDMSLYIRKDSIPCWGCNLK